MKLPENEMWCVEKCLQSIFIQYFIGHSDEIPVIQCCSFILFNRGFACSFLRIRIQRGMNLPLRYFEQTFDNHLSVLQILVKLKI